MFSIRRLLPAVVGLCSLFAVLGWGRVAAAQIQISQAIPDQTPRNVNPEIISKEDCETTNVDWTFTGIDSGDNVQVWVSESTDCSIANNRTMDGALCFNTGIGFSGSNNVNTVQTIALSEVLDAFPDVNACVDEANNADGRALSIYFLVNVSGSDTSNSRVATRYTQFDLVGTTPPMLDRLVSADDTLLEAQLSNLATGEDVQNYKVYCERIGDAPVGTGGSTATTTSTTSAGGTGGTGGGSGGTSAGGTSGGGQGGSGGTAGASSAGGSSTGGSSSEGGSDGSGGSAMASGCSSEPTQVIEGEFPLTSLERGTGSSDSILARGLDGGEWACAVAGTDNIGNPGVLSNVMCAVPEPVTDFFEAYRQNGGLAGGGFCQCSLPGADREHDWAAWAATALALSFLVRRKARERIRR